MFLPDVSRFAHDTLSGVAASAGVALYSEHEGKGPVVFSPECWPRVVARTQRVKLLNNHNPERPLGVADLSTDDRGWLRAECFFADTADGRDLSALARSGIGGLSVHFVPSTVRRETRDGQQVRIVDDCDLNEVSYTAMPRDPHARFDPTEDPREDDDYAPMAASLSPGPHWFEMRDARPSALHAEDAYRALRDLQRARQ